MIRPFRVGPCASLDFQGRCPRLVRLRAHSIGEVKVLSKST